MADAEGSPSTPPPPGRVVVRDALPGDRDAIVEFNARLARETEGKALDLAVLARGVDRALADPGRLRYWVAEDEATRAVVGQVGVTREWSDWRDGWLWWFQSVYVRDDARDRGVFRALHAHVRDLARSTPDVVGLRLYVEAGNDRAMRTYRALGLDDGNYRVFEELWPPAPSASAPA